MAPPQLPSLEFAPTSEQHLKWYERFWDVVSILIFSSAAINVLGKLQAENRTQAADIARKRGLV